MILIEATVILETSNEGTRRANQMREELRQQGAGLRREIRRHGAVRTPSALLLILIFLEI